ncbi:solute carrier family 35, member F1/2 [Paragonimus westermani]|uniref:Solute carrier family 35, member F1/2 n=1 Tax=Paragonimus westermani TaxID=34504 RepID=A0A5J4N5S7_9TREM|nr:solute carrier family 35, member F1/2 [Paragonimus westermani]
MHSFWANLAAYNYTSITSIQLLDCASVPAAMIVSFFLLRHRYTWTHLLGVVLSIGGTCLIVFADIPNKTDNSVAGNYSNSTHSKEAGCTYQTVILGDMLAILGAILYGISSVLQEYIVAKDGASTYLAWCPMVSVSLFLMYSVALERKQLAKILTSFGLPKRSITLFAVAYFFGYVTSMFALDILMAYTITNVSAAVINLSFHTTDVYALLIGIWLFGVEFQVLYFVAYGFIMAGVIIFALRRPSIPTS